MMDIPDLLYKLLGFGVSLKFFFICRVGFVKFTH